MDNPENGELEIQGLETLDRSVSGDYESLRRKFNNDALGGLALAEAKEHNSSKNALREVAETLPHATVRQGLGVGHNVCKFMAPDQAQAKFLQNYIIWSTIETFPINAQPYWIIGTNQDTQKTDLLLLPVHLYEDPETPTIRSNLISANKHNQLRAITLGTPSYRHWLELRRNAFGHPFSNEELLHHNRGDTLYDHDKSLFNINVGAPGSTAIMPKKSRFRKNSIELLQFASLAGSTSFKLIDDTSQTHGPDNQSFVAYDIKSHLDNLAVAFNKTEQFKEIYPKLFKHN